MRSSVGWVFSVWTFLGAVAWGQGWQDKLPIRYESLAGLWLACCAGVDVVITVVLYLAMRKSILGFNQTTDNAIRNLIRTSALTASYTSCESRPPCPRLHPRADESTCTVFGVAGAIISLQGDHLATLNSVLAFTIPLGVLYSLSLLVTLSSRKRVRRKPAAALTSRPSVFTHSPSPSPARQPHPSPAAAFAAGFSPSPSPAAGGHSAALLAVPRSLARKARSLSPASSTRSGRSGEVGRGGVRGGAGVSVSVTTDVRTEWDEPVGGRAESRERGGARGRSAGGGRGQSHGGRLGSGQQTLVVPIGRESGETRRESWED